MAIGVGSVVWLNSGQGPYTVISLDGSGTAILSQGNQVANLTVDLACITDAGDPTAQLSANKIALTPPTVTVSRTTVTTPTSISSSPNISVSQSVTATRTITVLSSQIPIPGF